MVPRRNADCSRHLQSPTNYTLDKEFRFTGTEVNIERRGDEVVLTPVEGKWARFVRDMQHISEKTADIMMRIVEETRRERTPPRDYPGVRL